MQIELITPGDSRWRNLLSRLEHDIYATPEYVTFSEKHEEGTATAIYGNDGTHEFLIPVLKRELPEHLQQGEDLQPSEDLWDAISPYGYSGVVTDSPEAIPAFLEACKEHSCCEKMVSLFLRWHPFFTPENYQPAACEQFVHHGETVFVDLEESEEEWQKQTRSSLRRDIRRLVREGYSVLMNHWEQYPDFVRIYNETMERLNADERYLFSEAYCTDLKEALGDQLHLGCVISNKGEVAAAALFFECEGIVQYHLSGASADHMKLSPTKLLLDHVRHWAKERGNSRFHLGGGLGGSSESPLFKFKAGFSSHRARFATSRIVLHPSLYQTISERAGQFDQNENFFPAYRKNNN